jgi:hypothetical protein
VAGSEEVLAEETSQFGILPLQQQAGIWANVISDPELRRLTLPRVTNGRMPPEPRAISGHRPYPFRVWCPSKDRGGRHYQLEVYEPNRVVPAITNGYVDKQAIAIDFCVER